MYLKARYLVPAIIAVIVILSGVVVSVRKTRENLEDFRMVAHTRAVMQDLQYLRSAMQDLVIGQRGYVITGEESFLAPYRAALEQVELKLDSLTALTRDNPTQQVRLGMLREVLRQNKEELSSTIDLRRARGITPAADIVKEGTGQRLRLRFVELTDEMAGMEANLLSKRQERMIRSLNLTNVTVVTSGIVALVLGLVGIAFLVLFLHARDRQVQLNFEKEKAVQADKAKSEFLAMMSHEIRTPMNAILGFGELLHDVVEKPQEKHFAQAVLTSGNSLLSLINDILDLSKIEASKLDINPESVETKRFLESLETLFSFRAAEKGIDYKIHTDSSVPEILSFDALRVRQVLINLIGNALKFTREGRLEVNAWCASGNGTEMELHFEVIDTGIGIAPEKLGEIFRPFYQIESIYGRNYQGTGLGLSISKRLIDLMGGKIDVKSEVGKGSTFHVVLPVERRVARVEFQALSVVDHVIDFNRLAPSKILVVDDVPLNRELICGYLSTSHHQVLEAENGEQAVILCRRHLPEIVLMDIRMPVVDGKAALTMLRSQEATRQIPLIAVTASSLLNSQEELKSIFDGFASKPISRERLFIELSKFLPARELDPEPLPAPPVITEDPALQRDWSELLIELEALKNGPWQSLSDLVPAQGTRNFAKQLDNLAREYDCPPLAEYAACLGEAAQNMNFTQAGHLLASYPQLIWQFDPGNV